MPTPHIGFDRQCPPIPAWFQLPKIPNNENSKFGTYVGIRCGRFGSLSFLIALTPDGDVYYVGGPGGNQTEAALAEEPYHAEREGNDTVSFRTGKGSHLKLYKKDGKIFVYYSRPYLDLYSDALVDAVKK